MLSHLSYWGIEAIFHIVNDYLNKILNKAIHYSPDRWNMWMVVSHTHTHTQPRGFPQDKHVYTNIHSMTVTYNEMKQ